MNLWRRCLLSLALLGLLGTPLVAKGSHASGGHAHSKRATTTTTASHPIKRSAAAKHAFEKETGYPHGRPGYVVDHVKPLACGGADAPSNMQWQTIADAKAKDKVERIGCR